MPDAAITRLNAALEGRYRIESELGEGGMATVYLADDLRHERKVALKVLKPELAAVVGAERFLAEIKTTANLQHPHILPLFDSGEAEGFLFYVMPYVEGESLRERLDREHQLPVADAVQIASDVAEALDYAHQRGVIHRDIKPANLLLHAGRPLIADFGIALAVSAGGGGRLTETGLSLGTPHYMSPEQATGDHNVGPATDIYALGCVLYEMLVGEPPHSGPSAQAVLVSILTKDPTPVTELRSTVPPCVAASIAGALEKLPADRFQIAAFRQALHDPSFSHEPLRHTSVGDPVQAISRSDLHAVQAWVRDVRSVALILLLITVTALWARSWRSPTPRPVYATRFVIELPEAQLLARDEVVVSRDGSRFAAALSIRDERTLHWRGASEQVFHSIPGTVQATDIAFSPDGEWLAYQNTTQDALLRVSLAGGSPTPIVSSVDLDPQETHWGDNGTIAFVSDGDLYQVSENGGEPVLLHRGSETRLNNPWLLPSGTAVIADRGGEGIVLLDLQADSLLELAPIGFDPQYVEPGYILFADGSGVLWALPFDPERLEVVGDAVPAFNGVTVRQEGNARYARFSASDNGTLVYGSGATSGEGTMRQLVVVHLDGNEEELAIGPRRFEDHRWSPDGRSIAFAGWEGSDPDRDIFTYDVTQAGSPRPLTFTGSNDSPVWSPDGERIAFASVRAASDDADVYVRNVNDNEPPQQILTLPGNQLPRHWVSDDLLVFENRNGTDLWVIDPDSGPESASPYVSSPAELEYVSVSSSRDLAAYQSSELGTPAVFVSSFPDPGLPERVSEGFGMLPRWSPDGSTIYFWTVFSTPVRTLLASRVQRGPPFVVTRTDTILSGRYLPARLGPSPNWRQDRRNARRLARSTGQAGAVTTEERFVAVVNWFEELRDRTLR